MSERITFKNMLKLVEKETGLDNTQSDRLLRRWFSIINEGLERDGRVRVSKFGTFKLHAVKERSGINPRTREAIAIPAHTKVVFNGAKHLKEIVNIKYNLLEAKPIKMTEKKSEKKVTKKVTPKNEEIKKETEKKEPDTELDNIMSQITEVPESENKELKYEETPPPVKDETKIEQIKRKQSDEVRAKIEEKFSKKENDFTPTGVMSSAPEEPIEKDEPPKVVQEEKTIKEKKSDEKAAAPAPEKVKVVVKEEKEDKEPESPIVEPKKEEEKKSKIGLWIAIAAFFILLVIVVLFWKPWEEPEEVIVEKPPVQEVVKPEPPPKPVVKKKVYEIPGGEHAVSRGDKLWDLSDEFYKDAYLWPNIYRVNDKAIPNPDILVIGNVVTVPPLEGTIQNLTATDSVNISVGFFKAYEAYKKYGNEWAKYYLWVCKKYDEQTFKDIQKDVEQEDAQFALTMN
jgi:integration host factor subunit alpha